MGMATPRRTAQHTRSNRAMTEKRRLSTGSREPQNVHEEIGKLVEFPAPSIAQSPRTRQSACPLLRTGSLYPKKSPRHQGGEAGGSRTTQA